MDGCICICMYACLYTYKDRWIEHGCYFYFGMVMTPLLNLTKSNDSFQSNIQFRYYMPCKIMIIL